MDKYYGNVCELDIIFNFQKAYFILDELLLARTGQGPAPHRGSDTELAEQGDAERVEMDRHDDALRRGDVDPDELRARAHERGPGQGPADNTGDDTSDDAGDDTRPLRGH